MLPRITARMLLRVVSVVSRLQRLNVRSISNSYSLLSSNQRNKGFDNPHYGSNQGVVLTSIRNHDQGAITPEPVAPVPNPHSFAGLADKLAPFAPSTTNQAQGNQNSSQWKASDVRPRPRPKHESEANFHDTNPFCSGSQGNVHHTNPLSASSLNSYAMHQANPLSTDSTSSRSSEQQAAVEEEAAAMEGYKNKHIHR